MGTQDSEGSYSDLCTTHYAHPQPSQSRHPRDNPQSWFGAHDDPLEEERTPCRNQEQGEVGQLINEN